MVPDNFASFPSFPRVTERERELKRHLEAVKNSIWCDWGNDHD